MGCFSGPSTTQRSKIPGQEDLWKKLAGAYEPEIGAGQPIYGGEWIAPFSPQQQAALGTVGQYTGSFAPQQQFALQPEIQEALSQMLTGRGGAQPLNREEALDVFANIAEKPTLRTFEEWERPLLREESIMPGGGGFWSSARLGPIGRRAEEITTGLGEARKGFLWDVERYNRELAQRKAESAIGAISPALSYAGFPTQQALARLGGAAGVFQALSPEQAQRQAQITTEMEKFAAQQRITDPEDLAILMQLLNVSFQQGATSAPGLGYIGASSFLSSFGKTLGGGMATPKGGESSFWG